MAYPIRHQLLVGQPIGAGSKLLPALAASCMAVDRVEYEWDETKRESNIHKHEIDFRDAVAVFDDAQCIFEDVTRPEYGEVRNKAIGRLGTRVICVIFTDRGDVRRIILARRSRRNERDQYRESAESS